MQRKFIWEGHKQQIEENNRGFLLGSKHFMMAMNKYGDLVRTKLSQRLKNLTVDLSLEVRSYWS